jgi:hypothetical protein
MLSNSGNRLCSAQSQPCVICRNHGTTGSPGPCHASRYGVVNATVTNDLRGKGTFSASINAEAFTGEATHMSGGGRSGIASGAGNRGSYLSCQYTMNSATQGTGRCKLSDGAEFTMHLGN